MQDLQKRRASRNAWHKEHMVSLTGFRLKNPGMYQCYRTTNDGPCLPLNPKMFLQQDAETGFYHCALVAGLLFIIPRNHLINMVKKSFRKDVYEEMVQRGELLVKTPGRKRKQ